MTSGLGNQRSIQLSYAGLTAFETLSLFPHRGKPIARDLTVRRRTPPFR